MGDSAICVDTPMMRLATEIREIGRSKGWEPTELHHWSDTNRIPCDLALIHSEVSEALEAFRRDDRAAFADELADTVIRVLSLGAGLGIDMDEAVRRKIEKNRTRSYRHGGKRV